MDQLKKEKRVSNHFLWLCLAILFWYLICPQLLQEGIAVIAGLPEEISDPVLSTLLDYYSTVFDLLGLVVFLLLFRHNRPILKSFLPGQRSNTPKKFLIGLGLGFLTNGICILAAVLHGDIRLTFSFSLSGLPLLLVFFFGVMIQSSSEELWMRGFLQERLLGRYPFWAAALFNGLIFALLHIFNPGISPLSLCNLLLCGVSYTVVMRHFGSIWVAMGMHTMWNFTQNFLFGLPNSGLPSTFSVFRAETLGGSLLYDPVFGVEGTVTECVVSVLLGGIPLILEMRRRKANVPAGHGENIGTTEE